LINGPGSTLGKGNRQCLQPITVRRALSLFLEAAKVGVSWQPCGKEMDKQTLKFEVDSTHTSNQRCRLFLPPLGPPGFKDDVHQGMIFTVSCSHRRYQILLSASGVTLIRGRHPAQYYKLQHSFAGFRTFLSLSCHWNLGIRPEISLIGKALTVSAMTKQMDMRGSQKPAPPPQLPLSPPSTLCLSLSVYIFQRYNLCLSVSACDGACV
jgi:hypothetical protein